MGKQEKRMQDVEFQIDEQQNQIREVQKQMYPDDILAEIMPSSDRNIYENLMPKLKEGDVGQPQNLTQEQLENDAFSIRNRVKAGMANNIEIRFDKTEQLFEGKKWPLGNTLFTFREWDEDAPPKFIYIKSGATLDLRVFIGGDDVEAVMAVRNESGLVSYTKLRTFHLVSVQENPDPQKEIGVVTCYNWLTANVYSSIVLTTDFNPLRELVLEEWLQAEWQNAKTVSEQAADKAVGGDGIG